MKILAHAALAFTLAHHAVAGVDDAHAKLVEKAHATYERDLERASRHPFREFEKSLEDGDLNAVKRMLDGGLPVDLQIPCPADEWEGIPPSEPAIHKAVRTGNLEMARLLLDRGAGASARDSEGSPPLHHVRNVDMGSLLISRGAKVSARDDDGWQAIHTAASGDLDLVKMLIRHGADPLARTQNQTQPIHQAARRVTPEMVAFFLSKGAKVDAVIRSEEGFVHNGWSALHLAANRSGDDEKAEKICRLLLAKGANPNALTDEGATPLHLSRSAVITRLLLEHDAKPDVMSIGISKNQPIHMFALHGDAESIGLLLDRGVDPNALTGNSDPQTPLDIAAFYNHRTDAAKLLLERGAIPTQRTLKIAEDRKNREMIRLIRARLDSRPKRPPHRQ